MTARTWTAPEVTSSPAPRSRRRRAAVALVAAVLTAAVTLTPVGEGWAWGAPGEELRWYLAGLDHPGTLVQLLGNLLLLVPLALTVHRLEEQVARPRVLVALAVATAASIEVLQLALPLGRVVSPLDAALNATGAVLAVVVAEALATAARPGRRPARTARARAA
ncbi:VanZ family protein [uncultured Pseudokineococcus sp.]|uniref:VanZ family protein n=1 Tax=uncultured Pseudokineococcus sp. TaxID=1642928 RepID=UPI002620DC4D|nr:VanZ family protein [uncultured Pseudokineococcus sp.]